MSLTNPFHAELVEDIHVAAFDRGYDVVVSPLTGVRDEGQTALRLVDQRCEALILLGPSLTRRELESLAAHTPVVVVGRRLTAEGVAVVRAADDRGVAAAVRHLTDLGHRRVAYVDGPPGPIATLRREGFRRAMRRFVGRGRACRGVRRRHRAGRHAGPPAATVLGRPRPYVCFNDRCALGVVDQLRRGRPRRSAGRLGRGLRRQPGGPAPHRLPHDCEPGLRWRWRPQRWTPPSTWSTAAAWVRARMSSLSRRWWCGRAPARSVAELRPRLRRKAVGEILGAGPVGQRVGDEIGLGRRRQAVDGLVPIEVGRERVSLRAGRDDVVDLIAVGCPAAFISSSAGRPP